MSEINNIKEVIIKRTINAKIDSVWSMWVLPENFQKWYGPEGATIPKAEFDLRIDGKRKVCMEMNTPNGLQQMWFIGEFLEVHPMTRLSYTESISNEQGDIISPEKMGMPEGTPEVTTITVDLKDMGATSTEMTLTHYGVPADSPGAIGWNMALDKLQQLLMS